MMLMTKQGRGGLLGGACALLLLGATLSACDTERLLQVDAPSRVPAGLFDDPKQATLMVNSAASDFECAFGAYVLIEGVISDELADAQLGAAGWSYDRRDADQQTGGLYGTGPCDNNQLPGVYTPLSTARWSAENALTKLQAWTDAQVTDRTKLIANAALYDGFSYAALGMAMCQASFDMGKAVDQKAMFAEAEKRFGVAIDAAGKASLPNVVNAALVGRARVRLFQGNLQGAADDAAKVPKGFSLNATAASDDNRRYNRVFASTTQYGFYTVEAGARALTTEGAPDPRAAVAKMATRAADAKSTIYGVTKYSGDESEIPIARYEEAQLILAEVRGGTQEVAIINALRDAAGLAHYTGATDAASLQQLIITERQRALFVEGFRNYDIQRFKIPFVPTPGTTYPNKGGTYGSTTCLPLPDIEKFNNPNAG